jgi:hypothetical protein
MLAISRPGRGINSNNLQLNTEPKPSTYIIRRPDLMTKYNVLLSKTHTLAASLSTPPTRKGAIGFKQIVPTPFAVNGPPDATSQSTSTTAPNPINPASNPADGPAPTGLDPQLDAMLEALLDGRRSMSVTKADVTNVARLHLPGEMGIGIGGPATGVAVGGPETVPPDVMLARLEEVRKAHDARCARGVEAVRQLKDKVGPVILMLIFLTLRIESPFW